MSRKRSASALTVFTPAKRTYVRKYPKRTSKYRYGIRSAPGSSTLTGFPKVMKFNHRLTQNILRTSDNTTNDYLSISTNGMYNPAGGWFGDQPYYFDQVSPLYLQYAVIASTCKFTVSQGANDPNGPPVMATAFIHATGARAAGNRNVLAMRPTSKTIVCSTGASARSINLRWSAKANLQSNAMTDDTLQGRDDANPSEQQFFQIVVGGPPGGVVTCLVTCDITYYAAWTELRDVAGS